MKTIEINVENLWCIFNVLIETPVESRPVGWEDAFQVVQTELGEHYDRLWDKITASAVQGKEY